MLANNSIFRSSQQGTFTKTQNITQYGLRTFEYEVPITPIVDMSKVIWNYSNFNVSSEEGDIKAKTVKLTQTSLIVSAEISIYYGNTPATMNLSCDWKVQEYY